MVKCLIHCSRIAMDGMYNFPNHPYAAFRSSGITTLRTFLRLFREATHRSRLN
jgi:hypothetical protein